MTRNQNDIKTEKAWSQLYNRLETDGLLSLDGQKKSVLQIKPAYYKWAASIAIVCISIATVFLMNQSGETNVKNLLTLENKKGSVTLVTTLEDGSIVYLSDNARLNYPQHFEVKTREVQLSGNAMFDVSGNKERPFLIDTKDVRVEVLGTSFYINNEGNTAFELAVRHGLVKVTHKRTGNDILVQEGETVRLISDNLQVQATKSAEVFGRYTQRIQFKDELLGNILRVVNKNAEKVTLKTTAELSNLPLTFTLSNYSPEKVAQLICLALDLTYSEKDGVLMITNTNQ